MSDIGMNIKKLRMEKGLTQLDLAKKLGITWEMISRYETGKTEVSLDKIRQIADHLGVQAADIVSDTRSVAVSGARTQSQHINLIPYLRIPFENFEQVVDGTKDYYVAPDWIIQKYKNPVAVDSDLVESKTALIRGNGILYVVSERPMTPDQIVLIVRGRLIVIDRSLLRKASDAIGWVVAFERRYV